MPERTAVFVVQKTFRALHYTVFGSVGDFESD